MMAVPGVLPAAHEDQRWAYEMKWDGVRALATVAEGGLALQSRRGNDVTVSYPELAGLATALGSLDVVLDGEVVRLDADGRPDFGALQHRMHVTDRAQALRLSRSDPVTYLVFDVLVAAGTRAIGLPYPQRRELLAELVPAGKHWQVTPWWSGGGASILAASKQFRLEGIIAKRLDSTYLPGSRSTLWRKVKNVQHQSAVIGGWLPGTGRRSAGIGSLLMGIPESGGLRFIGAVGAGLTDHALAHLGREVSSRARATSPFVDDVPRTPGRAPHWVDPDLVAEVGYAEWSSTDRLRHPVWRGLRPDLTPEDVVREG